LTIAINKWLIKVSDKWLYQEINKFQLKINFLEELYSDYNWFPGVVIHGGEYTCKID
jgi:hypothetical protein